MLIKLFINIKPLRENLAINKSRIYIGILLILFTLIFFFFEIDLFFLILLLFFVFFDLFKSKIITINIQNILLITSFIFLYFLSYKNYLDFKFFLFIFIFLNFLILILKKFTNYLFAFIILLFLIIFSETLFDNRNLIFLTICLSFINDTIAYLAGKNIGGKLIAPIISPKKTWSGTVVSFLLSFSILVYLNFNIFFSILLSLSLFFGDLFFSLIKRRLYIKDFSNSLSSHGGILDRIDSMFYFLIILNFYNHFYV